MPNRIEIQIFIASTVGITIVFVLAVLWIFEEGRMSDASHKYRAYASLPTQSPQAMDLGVLVSGSKVVEVSTNDVAELSTNDESQKAVALFIEKGCGGCHVVSGVAGAVGETGPNLTGLGGRSQIADSLEMNGDNLREWLLDPPSVKPGTLMPNLGLSEDEVTVLSNWLLTLK
mgnify:CR=1 FL=1|tara:strand:- start:122 stop:640 length:519 start_codon:yes stop_codon:yes gene_type:complete